MRQAADEAAGQHVTTRTPHHDGYRRRCIPKGANGDLPAAGEDHVPFRADNPGSALVQIAQLAPERAEIQDEVAPLFPPERTQLVTEGFIIGSPFGSALTKVSAAIRAVSAAKEPIGAASKAANDITRGRALTR